jgi:hypothetical protein
MYQGPIAVSRFKRETAPWVSLSWLAVAEPVRHERLDTTTGHEREAVMRPRLVVKAALATLALICTAIAADAQGLSANELSSRTIERRAIEAVIWGMPAVNTDLMLQEMLTKTQAKVGQVVYWGRPMEWHNQTLTPNPDAIYFMVFFNTKDGPLVLDLPPGGANGSFNANIVTTWQMPLEDAGLLGADKGAGGKYLILPPGYKDKAPDGYAALQSDTFGGYMLFRANLKSHGDADVAKAIAHGKQMKVYPLAQAANPAPTVFVDAKDVVFDSTIRYDASFFQNLDRIVQTEPWLQRDRAMIDPLKSLGIEKGKPFRPSQQATKLLGAAAREAGAYLEALYDKGWGDFFAKGHWRSAAAPEIAKAQSTAYADPDAYPIDLRGVTYSFGFVGIKRLGAGQFYLIAIQDNRGVALEGGKTYRLRVPPNVPIEQYWSVTAYDRKTHALIRNMPRASRSSQILELQKNADGGVDLYFGPRAPQGKESNWVPTDPKRGFELMLRLYGPKKAFFDKVWVLPDVENFAAK